MALVLLRKLADERFAPVEDVPAAATKGRGKHAKPWTAEMEALLRKYAGRMHQDQLARMLGVGRPRLHEKVEELGLVVDRTPGRSKAKNGWTEERIEEVRRRAAAGETDEDLARAFGISLYALRGGCRYHGIEVARAPDRKADAALDRRAKKRETEALAEKLRSSAVRRLKSLGAGPRTAPAPQARPVRGEPRPLPMAAPSCARGERFVRLQKPDGRWLSLDGLSIVESREHAYRCRRKQVKKARKAFPLAADCIAVEEPMWSPRDLTEAARTIG